MRREGQISSPPPNGLWLFSDVAMAFLTTQRTPVALAWPNCEVGNRRLACQILTQTDIWDDLDYLFIDIPRVRGDISLPWRKKCRSGFGYCYYATRHCLALMRVGGIEMFNKV